jgi:hypothetical protein
MTLTPKTEPAMSVRNRTVAKKIERAIDNLVGIEDLIGRDETIQRCLDLLNARLNRAYEAEEKAA